MVTKDRKTRTHPGTSPRFMGLICSLTTLPPLANCALAVFITQPLALVLSPQHSPSRTTTKTQKTAFNVLLTRSRRLWETVGVHEKARDIPAGQHRERHRPPQTSGAASLFLLRGFCLSTFVSGGRRRPKQPRARGFGAKLAASGGHRKVGRSGREGS